MKNKKIPIFLNHDISNHPVGYITFNGDFDLGSIDWEKFTFDVGFIPLKYENEVFTKTELVEVSIIPRLEIND
jgi:hypothetical protein